MYIQSTNLYTSFCYHNSYLHENCDNNITLFDKRFNKKIAPFQKEKHCDITTTIELNFFYL